MSLKHALLGILSYQPMTGYEIKRHMESSISYFWSAPLSQIYRTLEALEQEGWVTKQIQIQEGKPNRHLHSTTPKGQKELLRWLQEPLYELPKLRDTSLVKVFFGALLAKEEMFKFLQQQKELHEERLAVYREIESKFLSPFVEQIVKSRPEAKQHGLFWKLTLLHGIAYEETYIAWCEKAITEVKRSRS
ncbi:PadR family transcriptional regulator [Candidatus Acetothermia bacterium]|nr:PadR family transcriptional regulator [Candidatus Acetothermia bacterium]